MRLALLLASLLLSAGCSHTSPRSDSAAGEHAKGIQNVIRSIVLCETTEAELRASLGIPTRDGLLREQRIVSWITSDEAVTQYLAVLVNADGKVADLYWDIPTEIPWTPADQCANRSR